MEPGVTRGLPSPLGSCLDQPRVDSLWPGLQHVPYPVSRQQPPADCGILRAEQNRSGPSHQGGGFQKMARRRYQKPRPQKRGKQWTILVREEVVDDGQRKRKVKRVPLGPASLTRAQAERLRDDYLAAINQPSVGIGGACLFRDFARIYEKDILSTYASTTRERSKSVLKNYLNPELGHLMLREITLERLQALFAEIQQTQLSPASVAKIRDVLSSALGTAVDYERLKTNPAEKVRLKRRAMQKAKPFLRVEQFHALVELMREPYATMVFVAVLTGLRVSELIGLRWRNIHRDSIEVDSRYCRGDWDAPKSEASKATIPVDRQVIERIEQLKTLMVEVQAGRAVRCYPAVKSADPEELVFPVPREGRTHA